MAGLISKDTISPNTIILQSWQIKKKEPCNSADRINDGKFFTKFSVNYWYILSSQFAKADPHEKYPDVFLNKRKKVWVS